MTDQRLEDQPRDEESTSLDELNPDGAGAGADAEGSTFEPEEDD